MSKADKHHKLSNLGPGQAATAIYQDIGPAKRNREVKPDTPLASPP
ncbi:hypothetical protein A2U01_0080621, partial [Trifolium medium]|nr:hypothetical protein [Trifolium medium]